MRKFYAGLVLAVLLVAVLGCGALASTWTFEAMGGSAMSFPTPLHIYLESHPDIVIDNAEYETNPFKESPYYSWRFARWEGDKAWELELVHHKLYLVTEHENIQHFEITHGYNLITVNRAWKKHGLVFHLGGGVVLTHPETTIYNEAEPPVWEPFDTNYYVSGPTAQFAVGKKFNVIGNLFLVLEGKLTATYATIPVADGFATVPNVAAHGLLGVGYQF